MNILVIADPHIPVPPTHYGGAERIVHLYCQEFARLGHTVHLMAGQGSRSYGGRLHIHQAPSLRKVSRARRKIQFQLQSLWAAHDCDVVYNHGRFDYLEVLLALRKPLLHCFHNGLDQWQIDFAEARMRSNFAFHFLSESQRSQVYVSAPSVLERNFVDVNSLFFGSGGGGYLVFLGRLTRNKGVDIAIEVARLTGRRLVIAGNISKEDGGEQFFRDEIEPRLSTGSVEWIGPVDDEQKQNLLGAADALLFPIRWQDPCPVVLFEALACGAPVIATNRASVPEIIEHGVTGFLCDPPEPCAEAFAEAVAKLDQLDRRACRRAAEERFDVRVVGPRVLEVLSLLAQGASLP